MDVPAKNTPQSKPKTPAGKRPVKKRTAAEERESAALAKIAKNFRRVHVPRQQRGPQFLFVLLAFLGAALILYKLFGPSLIQQDSLEITDIATDSATGPVAGPIDSERFRDAIEAFEQPLLGASSSTGLDILAEQILRSGDNLVKNLLLDTENPSSPAVAARIQSWLDEIAAKSPPRVEDFAKIRREWVAMRQRDFKAATFFVAQQGSVSSDLLTLAAYRQQIDGLQNAVLGALDRAGTLAAPPAPGESPESVAARQRSIEEVASELRQQITELRQRQPSRPAGTLAPQLMVTIQSLEQALADASRLAASSQNLLTEGAYDNVRQMLDRAGAALDQLER